jgi:hypothetical protein
MKKFIGIASPFAVPAFFILSSHQNIGHPYIDPGTGSIIIQALIGGAVGALLALKIYWNRISTFFKNRFSRSLSE